MSRIHSILLESIKNVLNEAGLSGLGVGDNEADGVLKEYDEIGFANKMYTLWKVIEKKYSKTYVFRKNISFSKEKAFSLYPDAEFDENLKGKSHTFTVSIASGVGDNAGMGRIVSPQINIEPGQVVHIDKLLVTNAGIKLTRYNKLYYCAEGHDLNESESFDFVLSLFNNNGQLPHDGDILSVDGKINFFNEKGGQIYLSDISYEFVDRGKGEDSDTEEGTKLKGEPMVIEKIISAKVDDRGYVEKNGYIVVVNESGERFFIDTLVGDFRTGKVQKKFDTDEMHRGDKYAVSGTVQYKNGFKKLIRVKLDLIEANQPEPLEGSGQNKQVRLISLKEVIKQKKNVVSQKTYSMKLENMNKFFDYVWDYANEAGGKISMGWNSANSKEELMHSFEKALHSDVDYGGYMIWSCNIDIPQTKETIVYTFTIYFKKNIGESVKYIHNILMESIKKFIS